MNKGKGILLEDHDHEVVPKKHSLNQSDDELENYERRVVLAFVDQKEKYETFLELIDEYVNIRISGEDLMRRINILFEGNDMLHVGFKDFVCLKYEKLRGAKHIDILNKLDIEDFYHNVQERFRSEPTTFLIFKSILKSLYYRNTNVDVVESVVTGLLQDQQDLLATFRKFVEHDKKSRLHNAQIG